MKKRGRLVCLFFYVYIYKGINIMKGLDNIFYKIRCAVNDAIEEIKTNKDVFEKEVKLQW